MQAAVSEGPGTVQVNSLWHKDWWKSWNPRPNRTSRSSHNDDDDPILVIESVIY